MKLRELDFLAFGLVRPRQKGNKGNAQHESGRRGGTN